jgi:hypothetical protein
MRNNSGKGLRRRLGRNVLNNLHPNGLAERLVKLTSEGGETVRENAEQSKALVTITRCAGTHFYPPVKALDGPSRSGIFPGPAILHNLLLLTELSFWTTSPLTRYQSSSSVPQQNPQHRGSRRSGRLCFASTPTNSKGGLSTGSPRPKGRKFNERVHDR